MKFSTIFAGAFAAFAAAAPAATTSNEKRVAFDANQLNGLLFNQVDLNYLLSINALDLALFQNLGLVNNFDVLIFQDLFNAQAFNLAQLLQFQQLSTLLAVAGTGVFNSFDLSSLQLNTLNLGLIDNLGAVELSQFIDQAFVPQIQTIAQQVTTTIIAKQ